MAKTIKCNQCGAADLTKISDSEYICGYCHSRIVLEKPKLDLGAFAKTFNAEHLYQKTQTAYTVDGQVIKKASWIGCLAFLLVFLGILSSIIIPLFFNRSNSANNGETVLPDGWQLSYTQTVYYTNGSKGSAIWKFSEENYDWKKNRGVLTILDPVSKKELLRQIIIPEHESGADAPSVWDLFNGGKIFGDTIFFTPKNGGLTGRNIYTNKIVVDNNYLEGLIGNSIAEARAYQSSKDDYLEIKDAEGTEFLYFPHQKKVMKRDEYRDRKSAKTVNRIIYSLAGDHDKKYVLRIQQEMAEYENPEFFGSIDLDDYRKQKNYYKQYRKVQSVDSVPVAHGFFNAEILAHTDSTFIVKYKKNLLENSPLIFAKYDQNGKEIWSVTPQTLKVFSGLDDKKNISGYESSVLKNVLIIYITSPKASCGIDLTTGKTLWTFQCPK